MQPIILYGSGKLAEQVAHMIVHHFADQYEIKGFVDDFREPGEPVAFGGVTLGGLGDLAANAEVSPTNVKAVFAIGYTNMAARFQAFQNAKKAGYNFVNLIHPQAYVEPTVQLGEGTVVLAGSVIDQYITLGPANYVHIGCKFGEQCTVGANNYFSAGSTLGGSVAIGDSNFFGINCTVVNDVSIGSSNFLNAAGLIYRDVESNLRVVEYREQRNVAN